MAMDLADVLAPHLARLNRESSEPGCYQLAVGAPDCIARSGS